MGFRQARTNRPSFAVGSVASFPSHIQLLGHLCMAHTRPLDLSLGAVEVKSGKLEEVTGEKMLKGPPRLDPD